MKDIKEVNVFCNGDSNNLKTWSNVPYFFCNELEKKGIKVNRINYCVNKNSFFSLIVRIYSKIYKMIIEFKYNTKSNYKYNKTKYYSKQIKKNIYQSYIKNKNADINIVFDLSNYVCTEIPYVMIGDWTIDYRIKNRYFRNPIAVEEKLIKEQIENYNKADAVVSIFPNAYENIKKNTNKAYYIGHFINSCIGQDFNTEKRFKSNSILFIGRDRYKSGLLKIVKVVSSYNRKNENKLKINVIGMRESDFDKKDDISNCIFYGYLNKSDNNQKQLYYHLLTGAKMMINVTREWNGVSSLMEALFHGVPVIVSKNIEIESLIGIDKKFCQLLNIDCSTDDIEEKITYLNCLNKKEYFSISKEAQNYTKNMTWERYVENFLALMKKVLNNEN